VRAQDREQLGAEHDVAIVAPLAVADVDEHPLAIDVGHVQGTDLADAQPRTVGRHEDRPVFERTGGREQLRDFRGAQDVRQGDGHAGVRDLRHRLGALERHAVVEEGERGHVDAVRRRGDLLLPHQVVQKRADLRLTEDRRRAPKVCRESADTPQVDVLRGAAKALESTIGLHPVA